MLFKKSKTHNKNKKQEDKKGIYEHSTDLFDTYGLSNVPEVKENEKNAKKKFIAIQKLETAVKLAKGKKLRTTLFWSFLIFTLGGYIFSLILSLFFREELLIAQPNCIKP